MEFIGQHPKEEITKMFHDHVSSSKANFFKEIDMEFIFGKREGIYIWDVDGEKRLINCHCNGGVYNLGHRNPRIIAALIESTKELDIGNEHHISEQKAVLAKRLAELSPGDINYAVFSAGGGEAVDLAIKLARGYTKKHKVISAVGGYHGHTGFALATGDEKYRAPFGPLAPGFTQVPFGDVEEIEKASDNETAAVILETVPATLGMPIPEDDYYPQVRELCDKKGMAMIVDEVQTGLGRTGKIWGIEHFDVVPDIIVTAKGTSGGIYPIAATLFREELEKFFTESDPFIHVSTFGGADVGCPVFLEVLDIITEPGFLKNVTAVAKIFEEEFEKLKEKHPEILVRLRQLGLMMGIEMVNEYCGLAMSLCCYHHGILSVYANNDKRISQLLPPLIIDEAQTRAIIGRLDGALGDAKRMLQLAK
jgi:acetylornithine/succinyldiaminopimelate/putrescine aminotransferase